MTCVCACLIGGERIGFGLYQSGRQWDMCLCFGCGGVGGVGGGGGELVGGLGQGLGGCCGVMSVCCESGFFVLMAGPCICVLCWAHLRCTQCSILVHLIDICFLTCICLWQI